MLESQKAIVRNALDTGKPDTALATLRDMLRVYPDDANLHNLMGLTQLALKNGPRAVKHLQIAFKIDKQVATGLNLSSALIENGDHDTALKLLAALLKKAEVDRYPYKERMLHNIGYCHLKQGNLAKAEHWLKQTLEENPTFFPAHLELARLYEKTKRPAMAMKSYRQSVDYCHVCYEPVESLSMLYMRTGRHAEARKLLIQFGRIEGTADADRNRASRLLKLATTTGIPRKGRMAQKKAP